MDISAIENKISTIKDLDSLNAYKETVSKMFQDGINSLEAQLEQMLSLTNPATFIAKMIEMIEGTIVKLETQISDIISGQNAVSSAFDNQVNVINNNA